MRPITELSDNQIERFQRAAEDIVENTGFRVAHKELLRRAREAGAKVDEESQIVRLPTPLLRELLAQAPSSYTIAGQDGRQVTIGGEHQHCNAIVTDPWVIDYETQRPRRPSIEDVKRHTTIVQKLDRVVYTSLMDFPVTDFNDATSKLHAMEEHVLRHTKHQFVIPSSLEHFQQWMDLGDILIRGGDLGKSKLYSFAVAVVSPLTLSEFNAEVLMRACEHGFAVVPTICPMAGTTSPYSLASTLLTTHVENLLVAAMTQLLKPGNPFLYAVGPSVSDMRSGQDLYYTLDKVLWKLASVQLGKSCNLPTAAECGGAMTYRYDQQNGAEGILFMLAACASKANILAGIGSTYNAIGMSAEMMVIHQAWLDAAHFLVRGMDTDEDHLGVGSLQSVGPGGHFLTDDLTLRYLRSDEFFWNEIFDYSGDFEEGPPLLTRAHEKVEELVADMESPLPHDVQENVRRYFHDVYGSMRS